ncbi:MAG: hypothetical protein ACOCXJ_02470 [Planctomycetota bacterium]
MNAAVRQGEIDRSDPSTGIDRSDPYAPATARRNLITGAVLAVLVLLITLFFVWRFSVAGLPQDEGTVEALERRAEAGMAPGETTDE